MKRLKEVLLKEGANNSKARETIYTILLQSNEILNVSQILDKLWKVSTKRISQNTLYRHLNFFSEHNLVIVLQGNLKKSYYFINNSECPCFKVCPKCNKIEKIDSSLNPCKEHTDCDYIILYQTCKNCL